MKSKSFFHEIEKWSNIKKILFIPVLMAVLCLVGYLMLVLVYCIPEDTMKANMQESANIFEKEGSYPYIAISNYDVSQLDNFTDSLMLLTASNLKNESVWKAAVHTSNCLVDEYNPCQTLIYLYKENVTDANLITRPYSRYWHGYLIFLKPLLCLFNYQTLRYIMMLVQTGLFTLLVIKLAEKNKALIIPVFFTWIFLNPVTIMMSLQFNSVFMVTFTAMLIIAYRNEKWKDKPLYIWGVFFLIIGAFTSYLDLLTYPLVTLGLPILLWFSLNYSGNLKENLKKIVCISAFWTTGYGVMWASKWILGSIITRENILKDAKDSIQFRTSSNFNEQSFNFVDVISNQFKSSNNIIWICLILVFLFVLVKRIKKQMFNILVPCLFIAVYPFVWYAVLKNHSFIHSFFTYRELAITLYAVLAFIAVYRAGGGCIMDRIAVLIPCYNESSTIRKVVEDFKKILPEAVIYVYDNNSSDGTDVIAMEAGAVVRYEYQQGKGNVIRRMFREIDAECYIMVDGDDTYPAEPAIQMVCMVLDKRVDMVVGDRLTSTYFEENKRLFHNFGNSFVRKSINLLFKNNIKDIMTGYRAFSYEFVKTFPVLSKGFEIETEMSIHAIDKNMYIENVVIDYRDRPDGSKSKLNTYSDGLKVLAEIVRLYKTYKPMGFFGGIAFVLAFISACFFIPVVDLYIKTGLVPKFPTLIVCGFTMLAAVQAFFTGLTLQTMLQKNRQDFEMELHRASERKKHCI